MLFSFEGIILENDSLGLREIKQFGKKHQETWLQFLYASLRELFFSSALFLPLDNLHWMISFSP